MKKVIYYITPFVMFPVVLLLCNCIRYHITYTTVIIITIFLSLMMGILSPTRHKFDYLMTVIMPFAMTSCSFFFVPDEFSDSSGIAQSQNPRSVFAFRGFCVCCQRV